LGNVVVIVYNFKYISVLVVIVLAFPFFSENSSAFLPSTISAFRFGHRVVEDTCIGAVPFAA